MDDIQQELEESESYKAWHAVDPTKNGWRSYQAHLARVDEAIYLAAYFWPDFVEREGMILRRDAMPSEVEGYLKSFVGRSKAQIEYIVNHLHVSDIFPNDPRRDIYTNKVYIHIAEIIAQMWRSRLAEIFPNRNIVVQVANRESDPEVYALSDAQ